MTAMQLAPPLKPLPPQRWGFLATNQFWAHAALTPISVVFWVGAAVFFTCTDFFALGWWQQALGFLAFYAVWGGLIERYTRKYLAGRRIRLPADQHSGRPRALDDATAGAVRRPVEGLPGESCDLVPSQEERALPIVPTAEFWDYAFERLFGRAANIANIGSNVALALAIWYPGWKLKLLAFVALVMISIWLGLWQRRLLLSQLEAGGRAGPAFAKPSRPSLHGGDDR